MAATILDFSSAVVPATAPVDQASGRLAFLGSGERQRLACAWRRDASGRLVCGWHETSRDWLDAA